MSSNDLKERYDALMQGIAKDSNGEPTLVLSSGGRNTIRIIGWPIHYAIIVDTFERIIASYDRWAGGVTSGDSRKFLYMNACWVLDRADGKLKIMDFLGEGSHAVIDDLRNFKDNYQRDPGGMDSFDFQIKISPEGRFGNVIPAVQSIFTEQQKVQFISDRLKERLIEARRPHKPEEALELKNGTYHSRRYGNSAGNSVLSSLLEELYDLSKQQSPNPVVKQKLLAQYNQITGKKHPGFWIS